MRGYPLLLVLLLGAGLMLGWACSGGTRAAATTTTPPPKILFGLGPEADSARRSPLVQRAPVRMLTSWFNGASDLRWMRTWRPTVVLPAFRKGYALHLVVWDGGSEGPLDTPHGPACGRAYALSSQFLDDMRVLARTFAGRPRNTFYVTLFAEFQTYPCRDNAWALDPETTAYYETLKDQYRVALQIFHDEAPNALVSLGWGGWQAAWTNTATGGGRALFPHFADVMRMSGFQSFQSLNATYAVRDAKAMTRALARYGPVMLAFYKPAGKTLEERQTRLERFLSPTTITALQRHGLFALSFMDTTYLQDPGSLNLVESAVDQYACRRCRPP
jgi:hypothetical protein